MKRCALNGISLMVSKHMRDMKQGDENVCHRGSVGCVVEAESKMDGGHKEEGGEELWR